jgi:hypothetical protein
LQTFGLHKPEAPRRWRFDHKLPQSLKESFWRSFLSLLQ